MNPFSKEQLRGPPQQNYAHAQPIHPSQPQNYAHAQPNYPVAPQNYYGTNYGQTANYAQSGMYKLANPNGQNGVASQYTQPFYGSPIAQNNSLTSP